MDNYSQIEHDFIISCFPNDRRCKILDVGCGQGTYLIPLSQGHEVIGVEKSLNQLDSLRALGYSIIQPSEVFQLKRDFDFILMSHIIEHIPPDNLVSFMEQYLGLLSENGRLVIATPLLWQGFYDDYDHIKPYTPQAINLLFSDYPQHQEKPKYRLDLITIWVRRFPYKIIIWPSDTRMIKRLKHLLNRLFGLAFKISSSMIGIPTGWIGVYTVSKSTTYNAPC